MSDVEPGRHLMNQSYARQLKGKVVDRIEREGDSVKIWFNDGTANRDRVQPIRRPQAE
jgi:hypothetical protein